MGDCRAFRLAEHDSLSNVQLALTILPWNFVFAAGVVLSAGIAQQRRFPASSFLTILTAVIALAGPVCFVILARLSPDVLEWVNARNDYFWTGASKSLQSPLRVAYMAALAYLFIALRHAPVIRLIHDVSASNPLAQLGRKSLEVFAIGAIMALAMDNLLRVLSKIGISPLGSASAAALEASLTVAAVMIMLTIARNPSMSVAELGRALNRFNPKTRVRANTARA